MTEQKIMQFAAGTLREIFLEGGANDVCFVEIGGQALAPEVWIKFLNKKVSLLKAILAAISEFGATRCL